MKGEKTNLIILITLVLILLMMIGMFIGFFTVIKNVNLSSKNTTAVETTKKKNVKTYPYEVNDGKAIMCNLQDSSTSSGRIIRVLVELEVTDKKLPEEMKTKNIVIADVIDSVLRSKTAEELLKPEGKEKVRAEIKEKLNAIFDNKIEMVNFGEFIIQ